MNYKSKTRNSKTPEKSAVSREVDLVLTSRAASGDPQARHELATRLYDRIRRTVLRLVGSHSNVDDFVQLSIVEVILSLTSFRAESTLEAWADRITVRKTMRELKKQTRNMAISVDTIEVPSVVDDFENRLDKKAIRGRVNRYLSKIKPQHAEVLVLHHVLGYTMSEVATMTDVKLETSRARLKKARKKFRNHIQFDSLLVQWANAGEGSK